METESIIPIAIIGSGFSGLGLAIRLKQEGCTDFVVLERAGEVGGTWRDNIYPGCACDVPSQLYSFSFAPNPNWSRAYSPQPEILQYLISCADQFGVRPFIRFHCEVSSVRWDSGLSAWRLTTSQGEIRARSLVIGTGPLSEPAIPALTGLSDFRGDVFHSAEWKTDFVATGKNIAVIGTGASAVQFVPMIQPEAKKLLMFQRTAAWVVSKPNRKLSEFEKNLYRRVPLALKLVRASIYWLLEIYSNAFRHPAVMRLIEKIGRRYLKMTITDPVLREKLTPKYTIGCKRILLSDTYLPALAQPNVEVVTSGVREVRENSVVDSGDVEHAVDAIIFGTGFRVTDAPFFERVLGRGGESLSKAWQGSPKAYLGISLHGFPNLFFLLGPNTGLGHTSVVLMIEAQIEHVMQVLREQDLQGIKAVEPRLGAQLGFLQQVDRDLKPTVWNLGGCKSWYLNRTGRNSTIWPKSVVSYKNLLKAEGTSSYQETPK